MEQYLVAGIIAAIFAAPVVSRRTNFTPAQIYLEDALTPSAVTTFPVDLDRPGASLVVDYGQEVAGTPYFIFSGVEYPVQVEVRYSEELGGLSSALGDGPYPFSTGLSASFRSETMNVTTDGLIQSYFIQGGQRWQSLTQLTEGTLSLEEVGLLPAAEIPDLDATPGFFECSNDDYNEIWKLGSLASSAACLEAGTQGPTWEVSDEGALIRGQKPANSALGTGLSDYALEFSSKIVRGGTGWTIAQDFSSVGIQLLLVSKLPEQSTYTNTNLTITPPSSVVLGYGYSFVNQTTLPSTYLGSFELPFEVEENVWYRIQTSLTNGSVLSVTIESSEVLSVNLTKEYGVTPQASFNPTASAGAGSWGFGPFQDQIAVVKDVVVTANSNGTVLYQNDMKSPSILSEYGVARNNATVCLDGPKRDRLVWLGDFYHTSRIISSSNARRDHVFGTLQYLLDWQREDGLLPISPPMGYPANFATQLGAYDFLQDYQTLGFLAMTGYYDLTGDVDLVKQIWPGYQKQLSWLISQINSTTGLVDISGFTGPASGTAVSAQLVQALTGAANIAIGLGDTRTADNYTRYAEEAAGAIEQTLWNEQLGVYAISPDALNNYSVADIAFAITSGIASRNATRLASLITALEELKLGPGYKDSTSVQMSPTTAISPNINDFLLGGLMEVNATEPAKFLLDNLWFAMIANETTKTGASWEYVLAADSSPGLGLFTSLSHPWGGAPTYVLPQWLGGVRPVKPGYEEWTVVPGIDGFDLDWAYTRVPTKYGSLEVRWEVTGQSLQVNITAPPGTHGNFGLPTGKQLGNWTVNEKEGFGGGVIPLQAGSWSIVVEST